MNTRRDTSMNTWDTVLVSTPKEDTSINAYQHQYHSVMAVSALLE